MSYAIVSKLFTVIGWLIWSYLVRNARGDATIESDIDVMVILKGSVKPGDEIARTGGISAEISLKYDVVISCIFISAERYATEQSPLLINIHREGIEI